MTEGHGFESQRRQPFSSMKSQLKKSLYPFAGEVVQGACDRCKMYQFILGYMWQMYLMKKASQHLRGYLEQLC